MSHSRVVDSVVEKAQQLAQMGCAPELVQFVVDTKAKYNNLLTLAKVCIFFLDITCGDNVFVSISS